MPVLFASVLFLNALLLFWVQPLFAKMVLPVLGGSPSVWTTCMLFFQAALLAGYAYSHAGLRWLGVRRHAAIHAVIVWVPLLMLAIEIPEVGAASAAYEPVRWLLTIVTTSVGPPFVVLAATAPLLQRWYSAARRGASDPYWLYSASNAGSLAALLAFPILLEPTFSSHQQSAMWRIGYVSVAALLTLCAIIVIARHRLSPAASDADATEEAAMADSPTAGVRLRWLGLSLAPSSLLLGVTTYLSTDVASVPLLWVLPLSCYLLTFIVAFGWYSEGMRAVTRRLLPLVLLPLVFFLLIPLPLPLWFGVPLHVASFLVLALACHGELARSRPHVSHLTEFYLWVAAGGVLGGIFNSLMAPNLFTSVAEYPIAIALCCLLCVSSEQVRRMLAEPKRLLVPACAGGIAAALLVSERLAMLPPVPMIGLLVGPILLSLSVSRDAVRFAVAVAAMLGAVAVADAIGAPGGDRVVHADRTFFGVYRVRTGADGRMRTLMHGTTLHGRQRAGDRDPEPLSYYHRGSPIGQILQERGAKARSVGAIGLGAGTLAAYAQPDASWTFYEIDAAVERIARDTRFFTYLDACGSRCRVVLGDARLTLAQQHVVHDVLIVDAFSSDAIPMHLLTVEAMKTYESRLAADGLLVLHISNRHIGLRPVVARLARDRGFVALVRRDPTVDQEKGYQASEWAVMARDPAVLDSFSSDSRWTRLQADDRRAWSDDFSNIWTELR